jgi:hypothetical protein
MTLAVIWLSAAMNAYRSLRVTDPEGARHIARGIVRWPSNRGQKEAALVSQDRFQEATPRSVPCALRGDAR